MTTNPNPDPSAVSVVPPATNQTALRDRAADAIRAAACPGSDCPRTEAECSEQRIQPAAWERGVLAEVYGRPEWFADAVLAVLPAPVDRAAVLREAAEALGRMDYDTDSHDYGYDTYRDAWNGGVMDGADLLRRLADEAAVVPPPALTEEGRLRAQVEVLQQDAERDRGLAKVGARCMREGHQGLIEQGRLVLEGWRFALSTALGLGTGAPWEAIHDRAKELAAEQPAVGSCVAAETPELEAGDDPNGTLIEDYLRFLRGEGPEPDLSGLPPNRRDAITGQFEIVKALADRDPSLPPLGQDPVARRLGLHAPAAEAPHTETPDAGDLAAMLEGFARLLATSSRDWGQYRVDAWLWAVLVGWDCEQDEHDETCVHGAMQEMQQRHGWDDAAVAKARRYRAAVRALTAPAVVAQPGKEHGHG